MNRHPLSLLLLVAAITCLTFRPARAAEATTQSKAELSLDSVTEEGQKTIRATVKVNGKPVENVAVSFAIKRTFGMLALGDDKTLDDGTAAMKFPTDLPGDAEGNLQVVAQIKAPAEYAGDSVQASLGGAKKFVADSSPLPRALWSPTAPYELIIPITVLLCGVWSAYAFVVAQIVGIRKGARS